MIYLDTHVVVWLYAGKIEKLSEVSKELINGHEVIVSPVVRLELQYLFEIDRITDKANEILFDLSDRIGLTICDQSLNTIVSCALDLSWTRDPFDRMIVANAAINQNNLITKDQNILENYEKAMW
ncbi:MAG: type II toxin-antitoxin system VapC family toxin [Deltaproteobacteria bacterium]|nr:type II toxin-antitoxin system VapC family toxin [Deltaproteobacteria bacterium]